MFFKKNKNIQKPHILLLCDRPNWAYHNSAVEVVNQLSDEFSFDIKFVINNEKINQCDYDAILVYFWGEQSYKQFHFPKRKIMKKVASHRWQDNPAYGPLSPKEFVKKYLGDCKTAYCPSQILYNLLKNEFKNLVFCGDGYSPIKFYFLHERAGEMKMCMVGNLKDPVKGVEDILIPSAKGFCLDLANDLKHEELCKFYNDHDVYVVSSRNEANPLPLMESMACGCFPVACKVGIAPEIIRHKENGYLVENRTVEGFKEAFDWCNKNLDYIRKQAKKNAEEMYEKRRWEVMADGYRKMFRKHLNLSY